MAARKVKLTDHLDAFVEAQVVNGRHEDASDVVREALRRYEADLVAEVERVAAIRTVIQEGRAAIAAGDFMTIEGTEGDAALRARFSRRLFGSHIFPARPSAHPGPACRWPAALTPALSRETGEGGTRAAKRRGRVRARPTSGVQRVATRDM